MQALKVAYFDWIFLAPRPSSPKTLQLETIEEVAKKKMKHQRHGTIETITMTVLQSSARVEQHHFLEVRWCLPLSILQKANLHSRENS
jgi:hypothetical protein